MREKSRREEENQKKYKVLDDLPKSKEVRLKEEQKEKQLKEMEELKKKQEQETNNLQETYRNRCVIL